jgi:bifunctional non-homologous end joining protein LigD
LVHRFPAIIEAAGSLRVRSIALDGEAVVCGDDGVSDFDRLHSQGWDCSVFLYAFDLVELDGEDLIFPRNCGLG